MKIGSSTCMDIKYCIKSYIFVFLVLYRYNFRQISCKLLSALRSLPLLHSSPSPETWGKSCCGLAFHGWRSRYVVILKLLVCDFSIKLLAKCNAGFELCLEAYGHCTACRLIELLDRLPADPWLGPARHQHLQSSVPTRLFPSSRTALLRTLSGSAHHGLQKVRLHSYG